VDDCLGWNTDILSQSFSHPLMLLLTHKLAEPVSTTTYNVYEGVPIEIFALYYKPSLSANGSLII